MSTDWDQLATPLNSLADTPAQDIDPGPDDGGEAIPWKRVNIGFCARHNPPPRRFAIGKLPVPKETGVYGLLLGPDGTRKSWLALHIAMAKAGGQPVAGGLWPAPEPGRVVYVTTEDDVAELWERIHAIARQPGWEWVGSLGHHLDILAVPQITLVKDSKNGPARGADCTRLIRYAKGASLIVLDPLADLADADDADARASRMIVQTLRHISRSVGAAVLVVHHQNKVAMLAGNTNHQSGRGNTRIGAGARWAVVLQPMDREMAELEGIDIADRSRWTAVHESKASYAHLDAPQWFYHWPTTQERNGAVVGGVPLFRKLPSVGKTITKKARAYSQASNVGIDDDDDY